MQAKLKEYKAYLFDMDGTLVSSEKLKGNALTEACGYFNGKVDVNIYKEIMGGSWDVVTNHFFKAAQISPDMDDFNNEFNRIYRKLLKDELELTPYAKELLYDLSEKGKKIGLVSSSATWMVNQILNQFQLANLFDVVITGEDVTHHKPHPEAYLLALNELYLSNSEVLIFEDSSAGLLAAKAANYDAFAIEHEFNANNDLSLALKVITDFSEVMYNKKR